MVKIKFKVPRIRLRNKFSEHFAYFFLCVKSLFYNAHLSQSYVADVCLEPIFKIVDSKIFSRFLGPFFVIAVTCLTSAYVIICYWIGLPYWWSKSPEVTVLLMIVGNWLLLNVSFHYFMAAKTNPGAPPTDQTYNAVNICKKCLIPKPPRKRNFKTDKLVVVKYNFSRRNPSLQHLQSVRAKV